jgi:hypothetical protein
MGDKVLLSTLKWGEGELCIPFEHKVPEILRRELRAANERPAIRRGPFGGRVEPRVSGL